VLLVLELGNREIQFAKEDLSKKNSEEIGFGVSNCSLYFEGVWYVLCFIGCVVLLACFVGECQISLLWVMSCRNCNGE